MSSIEQLVRSVNPIPEPHDEFGDDDVAALLLLTRSRSGTMDTKEAPSTRESGPRRSAWVIGVVSFAVVLIIAAVLVVLGTTGDDRGPASPATTEAAPATPSTTAASADGELTPEEEALVAGLVQAFNGLEYRRWPADVSAFLAFFDRAAEIRTGMTTGEDAGAGGTVEEFWAELQFRAAMHSRWDVVGCRTESGAILCQVDFTHDAPASRGAPLRVGLRLVVENGLVRSLALSAPASAVSQAVPEFYDWVAEHHPEDLDLMRGPGSVGVPNADPVSIDLWRTYLPEYYAAIDGGTSDGG
jgi:hypothetical protein